MNKHVVNVLIVCALAAALALSGCGNSSSPGATDQTVFGVAATGAPISGTVTLQDSSTPPVKKTASTDAAGKYSIDVAGLTGPFILGVESEPSGTMTGSQLYSFAAGPGRANINPFSHVIVLASADVAEASAILSGTYSGRCESILRRRYSVMDALKAKLAPLLELYGVTQDPIDDEFKADHTGLDALLDAVSITISNGTILIKNRETGGVIFTAPLRDISSGTFYAENLPDLNATPVPAPAPIDGGALYASECSSCHGSLDVSEVSGESAAEIQVAITGIRSMQYLSILSLDQIKAIAAVLASSTPAPSACAYTYSSWGTCQSDGMQTRTMLTESPSGCTGTPVLSRSCTYVPPIDGVALYTQYCSGCHGNGKKGSSASSIQSAIEKNRGGMGSLSFLTLEQISAISAAP